MPFLIAFLIGTAVALRSENADLTLHQPLHPYQSYQDLALPPQNAPRTLLGLQMERQFYEDLAQQVCELITRQSGWLEDKTPQKRLEKWASNALIIVESLQNTADRNYAAADPQMFSAHGRRKGLSERQDPGNQWDKMDIAIYKLKRDLGTRQQPSKAGMFDSSSLKEFAKKNRQAWKTCPAHHEWLEYLGQFLKQTDVLDGSVLPTRTNLGHPQCTRPYGRHLKRDIMTAFGPRGTSAS